MNPTLNIAIRAARAAGNIILRYVDRVDTLRITAKSHQDFVSEVDRRAEQAIIETIRKAYPDHGFLAEESGRHSGDHNLWIIDPLDGTTNFLHGFPVFSVSIALQHGSHLEHAVVYDPLREELFIAARGQGAQLNNRRIRVSQCSQLRHALVGTGFPFRALANLDCYLEIFRALLCQSAGIRRAGSAALDLAYVASGRLDGFWEFELNPWDMAAGMLLVREAGGLVAEPDGSDQCLTSGNILAANPKVFLRMREVIQPRLPLPQYTP